MARKKTEKNGVDHGVDAMFATAMSQCHQTWGDKQYLNGHEESRVICLKVPLALQFLLQQEGFTLGRFTTIVGPPESCKSALSYEFFRLHRQQGGGFVLIETEKKDSPQLRKSITGYDPRRCAVYYVEFIEEWMACLEDNLTYMKGVLEKDLKPPCSTPWCFVVDSLSGVTTRHIGEKIDEEGSASLVQPQAANIISTYMKRLSHWFADYPFSVLAVNHLKLAKDQHGNSNVRNLQGGYAPRFSESLEIEMTRLDKKQIDRRAPRREQGIRLGMRVAKNSNAPHSPQVPVEMLWYMEPYQSEDGTQVEIQRTYFDWPSAAIELLLNPPVDSVAAKEVAAIVDLHPSTRNREVWSDALGISENDPVSYHEAGKLLEVRRELCEALYRPLGIRRRQMFVPGVDYKAQKDEAARRAIRIQNDGIPVPLPEDPQRVE